MLEEHWELRQAATELMCNLTCYSETLKWFEDEKYDRLKVSFYRFIPFLYFFSSWFYFVARIMMKLDSQPPVVLPLCVAPQRKFANAFATPANLGSRI